MARRRGFGRDHQEAILALAKAILDAIEDRNRQSPDKPFPIDDAVSRILANHPDYVPPRKRKSETTRPPTKNPGIFTVKRIADDLGRTVGSLLGERGFEIISSDRRSFRWIVDFIRNRFLGDAEVETALPEESTFVAKDFSYPRPLITTRIARKGELAAGLAGRESEFEIGDAEVVGTLNSPSLCTATVKGRSMSDRIRDGDTIVIDTAQTTPKQGQPVAVHIQDEGGILGYWRAEAGQYFLDKHNVSEFQPVKLPHTSYWRVIGVVVIVQSLMRRQDRPTRRV